MTSPEPRFELVILGDFSGRGAASDPDLADFSAHTPPRVDVDTFDDLWSAIAPGVDLPQPDGSTTRWHPPTLDALHPEVIAAELPNLPIDPTPPAPPSSPASAEEPSAGGGSSFEELLQRGSADRPRETPPPSNASEWVEELARRVSPGAPESVEANPAPDAAPLLALLRSASFRRLEAHWRSLHRLVTRTPDTPELALHVVDITHDELRSGLRAQGSSAGALPSPLLGGDRFRPSLIVAVEPFTSSRDDLGLLTALGIFASLHGAPILGEASSAFVGQPSWSAWRNSGDGEIDPALREIWEAIRTGPVAPWLGLTAPRPMARQPYGATSDPTDAPAIEEISTPGEADEYPWGSSALAAAELLATSFTERGWAMGSNDHLDLEDLPSPAFQRDGEPHRMPPTEIWLDDGAVSRLEAHGLMVWMSDRQRNRARLAGVHSIAEPATPLAGAWERG